jgi:hypothetical protein
MTWNNFFGDLGFIIEVEAKPWLLKVYPLCRSLLPRYWVSFDTYHRPRYILFSGSLLTRYWVSFDTYHRPRYILFSGSLLTLYWVSFDTYHRS